MSGNKQDPRGVWRVERAEAAHIPAIAARMRASDRREVWASHRHTPSEALQNALARSELAWTCLVRGEPALMWGAGDAGARNTGSPWLLGTADIDQVSREFLRQSRDYVARMHERFPRLENCVHHANRPSIRWLRWCGFTVESANPARVVSIHGEPFFRFWRFR